MENMNISADKSIDFRQGHRQAVNTADENLTDPAIIAWKDDKAERFAPDIPGGAAERWHFYGENFGGKLELNVGDDFHFILIEAKDFDDPDLNLTTIKDEDGTSFTCVNNACTEEDLQRIGYFPGGGIGG